MAGKGTEMLKIFRRNLEREITERKVDMKNASTKAGLGATFVRDVLERERDPQLSYIARLARTHGLSLDRLLELRPGGIGAIPQPIKVIGEVGAGIFRAVDDTGQIDFERDDSPFPPDPNFPVDAQFDLIVRGSSINRFARDGERVRCVDVTKAGIEPLDDDLVIFEQRREGGALIETTAKRIRRRGRMVELWPDSDDPRWQEPLRVDTSVNDDGRTWRIVALVLYAYNPARRTGRR